MPELEAFPRSHIVTFKYYVGVIQFLEEDYAHVSFFLLRPPDRDILMSPFLPIGRRKPHLSLAYVPQIRNPQRRVSPSLLIPHLLPNTQQLTPTKINPNLPNPHPSPHRPPPPLLHAPRPLPTPLYPLLRALNCHPDRLPFRLRHSPRGRRSRLRKTTHLSHARAWARYLSQELATEGISRCWS